MSDDEDIPDVTICQERVEKFAEITGTDEACAQFYLQDRKWDLEVGFSLSLLLALFCVLFYYLSIFSSEVCQCIL